MSADPAHVSSIRVLPDLLVNKIAAGEVIERPASVVKELVENAVDAGASHVGITIEDGGKRLIRVTDDGGGMTATDLRLAVTPHATSKIACEDDLFNIATLGFRGEALPSIGAVSHMRIVSRRRDSVEGAEIVVSAERIESASAAGCRVGTTVEVRDLFFNVPARRKFLRANATEVGHVNEQFARMALANRDIGFELENNGRKTYQLPTNQSIRERIGALYGAELAGELMSLERMERGLHIEAYVAPPSRSRATPAGQYVLLNGRFIRDRFVQHAIREAYRGLMEHNRHPVVFLFLTIDPALVDVNVHPTKIEVRWQDSNSVHSQVLAALREKFLTSDLTPALRTTDGFAGRRPESRDADTVRREAVTFFRDLKPPAPGPASGDEPWADGRRTRSPSEISPETWQALYGSRPADSQPYGDESVSDRATLSAGDDAILPRPGRAIQVHNSYLVAETDDGIVIIDQHALHERVMYEKLKSELVDGPLEAQRLLLPETMTVTGEQMALVQEHADLLHQIGVEASPFGSDTIAIHAFPSILKDVDAVAFVRDLLDRLAVKGSQTHAEEVIHDVLDMMACKAAVKAGDPLTPEEIDALLLQKSAVEKSSNCPHGRPTTLRLSMRDLEKQFKRR